MILLKITDIKLLMQKLLSENETAFDSFLLSEAVIRMSSTYVFDGHINKDFYSSEELEELETAAQSKGRIFSDQMVRWSQTKLQAFSIIKGKKTPSTFSFVFYLAKENINKFTLGLSGEVSPESIAGLMLKINYDGSTLTISTGSALNIFSLDKTVDKAWDEMVKKFISSLEINYEEL